MSGRLLLDSHVFMWLAQDVALLRPDARRRIETATQIFLSTVSVAELCIESSLGKLRLPVSMDTNPARGLRDLADAMAVVILPLELEPAAALHSLPLHHRDPFDRLIIAQAMLGGLTLVTHDRRLGDYTGLDIVWT